MKSTELADKYAEALYEVGKEEESLDKFINDLDAVADAVSVNEFLPQFLDHPLVPDRAKSTLLESIFGGKVSPRILNFLKILVRKNRESYLQLICERLHKIRRDKEDVLEVQVTVPPKFDVEGLENDIRARLSHITDRQVAVTKIDRQEGLIGGAKLAIGEKVIDGSVKAQIEELRDFVLGGEQDGRN